MWLKLLLGLKLSDEDRNKLVTIIIDRLGAMPLHGIISQSESGELLISGKAIDMEKMRQLQGHARAALENKALNLIREQVVYESFVGAAFKSTNTLDLLFGRAALWWGNREEYFLTLLAGRETTEE